MKTKYEVSGTFEHNADALPFLKELDCTFGGATIYYGTGIWKGTNETSVTYVTSMPLDEVPKFKEMLREEGRKRGQEAVYFKGHDNATEILDVRPKELLYYLIKREGNGHFYNTRYKSFDDALENAKKWAMSNVTRKAYSVYQSKGLQLVATVRPQEPVVEYTAKSPSC